MKQKKRHKGVVYFKDLREYAQKYFGKSIPLESIEDKEAYAEVFAEGCEPLKQLLLLLWARGYVTIGCCKGHELPEIYINTERKKRHSENDSTRIFEKATNTILFLTTTRLLQRPRIYYTIYSTSRNFFQRVHPFTKRNPKTNAMATK